VLYFPGTGKKHRYRYIFCSGRIYPTVFIARPACAKASAGRPSCAKALVGKPAVALAKEGKPAVALAKAGESRRYKIVP